MQKKASLRKDFGIVLFGGSFDPIHNGHLQIASAVLDTYPVEQVIFIPCQQSPLKGDQTVTSPEDRLKMLSLAIESEARYTLDALEIDRGGTSFTSDTVHIYRERYPGQRLYWILGEDQFNNLCQWNAIEYLIKELIFLVYPRENEPVLSSISEVHGITYEQISGPKLKISSTQVRELCESSKTINGLVPKAVEAFIHSKNLYKI